MSVVVFNAGSSSLKFGIYDETAAVVEGIIDWTGRQESAEVSLRRAGAAPTKSEEAISNVQSAVTCALHAMTDHDAKLRQDIVAVGQRVVHGGAEFSESVRIDVAVAAAIARLADLAPLHNPPALEAIDAVKTLLPGLPQIAVFDTSFYAALPPEHHVYPLPYEWYVDWGIRRFGFHGISHDYCARRAAEMLQRRAGLRVITCHLGSGCSATATQGGLAVATTMGFTPMDGLMMGSRGGSLDPGILLYVQKHRGLTVDELDHLLNHGAGLKGVSGVSSDYRRVETAAKAGNVRATLSLEMFAGRVREAVGALSATLGGIDALVLTAGIGEHAPNLRAKVCLGLEFLGIKIDPAKNTACAAMDSDIALDDSSGRILVVHTREEWMIAQEVYRQLNPDDRRRAPAL